MFNPNDIRTGELLVIVEYCRYGNLRTYLMNHRDSFINLVDEFGNTQAGNEMEEISLMAKYERIKTYSDFRIPNNAR